VAKTLWSIGNYSIGGETKLFQVGSYEGSLGEHRTSSSFHSIRLSLGRGVPHKPYLAGSCGVLTSLSLSLSLYMYRAGSKEEPNLINPAPVPGPLIPLPVTILSPSYYYFVIIFLFLFFFFFLALFPVIRRCPLVYIRIARTLSCFMHRLPSPPLMANFSPFSSAVSNTGSRAHSISSDPESWSRHRSAQLHICTLLCPSLFLFVSNALRESSPMAAPVPCLNKPRTTEAHLITRGFSNQGTPLPHRLTLSVSRSVLNLETIY